MAAKFKQFQNTDEGVETVEVEKEGQSRPVYWTKGSAEEDFKGLRERWSNASWHAVIEASHFNGADALPNGISATIKRSDTQLAVWRFRGRFYATQQIDDSVVSSAERSPWSLSLHKRNFDLGDGSCSSDKALSIATFPWRPVRMAWFTSLPPVEELDAALGTSRWKVRKASGEAPFAELDGRIRRTGQRARKPKGDRSGVGAAGTSMAKPVELMAGEAGRDVGGTRQNAVDCVLLWLCGFPMLRK
ncbi:nitrite reductase [Hirsutella rhossiliensis]|uniref:Nitrite reductase n=1 Tax=Hirsutella rhossiliensis TaxID=111463 RepID=A0A9P8MUW1_9HYPO|nr:nitrite reductase [Hirsutella rhossiliensis]KAH0961675.1 nitrite reductase [Hirsutella rhossiliensis]